MRKIVLSLLLSLIALLDCAIQTHQFQTGVKGPEAAVAPAAVKIYSGPAPAGSTFKVLGSVAVDAVGDADAALAALKNEAGKMGANAVMNTTLTKANSFAQRTGLSGVAIRIQ
jgi:hypothetical protein